MPMGHVVRARQADSDFVDMLAEVRAGAFTPAAAAALQRRCSRPLDTTDGILPTKACSSSGFSGHAPAPMHLLFTPS